MNERFARAERIARVDLAHERDFALGSIQVRPARRQIVRENHLEMLEPRVMRVLVALARMKNEILSRDDLIECCWDGIVVGEDAINRSIGQLRKAAEATGNPFSIETIPRIGYRLRVADIGARAGSFDPAAPGDAMSAPVSAAAVVQVAGVPLRGGIAPYISAAALLLLLASLALWREWPKPPEIPGPAGSVAVLPFVNLSGSAKGDYFSDGFSEELLNELSNDPQLRVTARTSAFAFKGKNEDTAEIARALHVRAIVEGSVRESGNRVRINAQLIDATGYNIWSGTYDQGLSDILTIQDQLARAVAAALTHRLLPAPPRPGIRPAAYRSYLQGLRQMTRTSGDGYGAALVLFQQVTRQQPDFADGFVALSHAALSLSEYDPAHGSADVATARDAAQHALMLDSRNSGARLMLGLLDALSWNWRAASADVQPFLGAWQKNARMLWALRVYYNVMGFPDEATALLKASIELDPLSPNSRAQMIYDLLNEQRTAEAMETAREILARQPNDPRALYGMCSCYAAMGKLGEARNYERQLLALKADQVSKLGREYCAFHIAVASGNIPAAEAVIDNWVKQFPDEVSYATDIADDYVEINKFDKASDWYERAYDRREPFFFRSVWSPGGAKYRMTSRWKTLTQKPAFREWQAEHDRIAAELNAGGLR